MVFTNPADTDLVVVDTAQWSSAYDELSIIINARSAGIDEPESLRIISTILLRTPEDDFLAWMIACFIPWAREPQKYSDKPSLKKLPSAASTAARGGIKADNKVTKIVDDAVSHLSEIIAVKDSLSNESRLTSSSLKRKQDGEDRVSQGQAIRRWGSHWRTSAMYALLTQVGESESGIGE